MINIAEADAMIADYAVVEDRVSQQTNLNAQRRHELTMAILNMDSRRSCTSATLHHHQKTEAMQ